MALADIGNSAMNILAIVVIIIVTMASVASLTWLIIRNKRYKQFRCIVWEKGINGAIIQSEDGAGIFTNRKTNNKRFWMKKANVGLIPDNIPYIQHGKEKLVYLVRVGLKNFYFLKPDVGAPGDISFTVGEEDVNWSINAYEAAKKRFSNSLLMQLLPFAVLIFVCLIILILFLNLFKKFDSLKEMLAMLLEIAKYLAQAKTGVIT